ncbi:MAG TPA: type III pantothenate kinase [Candidatus Angelobacter sp.]|jgi:type III pantothenate kinase|nr:type III pantothenate kinase [Candidatus Angelobacter sp.]
MLLAIDVGNTNVVLGVFEGEELVADFRLHTDERATGDEMGLLIVGLLGSRAILPERISAVVVSNVVPILSRPIEELSQHYFKLAPMIVGPGIRTGMRILYEDPRQVGADRIVNALAAFRRYGGPAVLVDFGTATTFDAISPNGDYLGGAIAPGIVISLDALVSHTAKLTRVELAAPPTVVGRNTTQSMQAGLVFGYVGLIEGIVARMKAELGDGARVIATGGLAELIAAETAVIDTVDQRLTLDGLRIIHDLNAPG